MGGMSCLQFYNNHHTKGKTTLGNGRQQHHL